MRQPDHVLTRYQLLEGAWDAGYEHHSNIIDVYIRCLRDKLDRPFGVESIERSAAPATGCGRREGSTDARPGDPRPPRLTDERLAAEALGLSADGAYMTDLEEEIAVYRHALVGASVTEIAVLRGCCSGAIKAKEVPRETQSQPWQRYCCRPWR